MPQKITGLLGLNPGKASCMGFFTSIIVSPTLQSDTCLILPVIKPTSPAHNSSTIIFFGLNTPTLSIICSASVDIILIVIPFLMIPSITLTSITTPKYLSYQLSTSIALSGDWISPFGGGRIFTMASKTSSIPFPVLADISIALLVSRPITSSIWLFILSGSDAGKSILFKTNIISWLLSIALYVLARVWASTPWDASITKIEPSHAASDLSTS